MVAQVLGHSMAGTGDPLWCSCWAGDLWGEGQVWSREQRPKTLAQHHCSVQRALPKEGAVGCQMVPVF